MKYEASLLQIKNNEEKKTNRSKKIPKKIS